MQTEEDNLLSYTLPKREKLCSQNAFDQLLNAGQSFFHFPYKCYFFVQEGNASDLYNQFAIAVPKRIFKHAVDRNLLKRKTREAYRLHKHILFPKTINQNKTISILFVYMSKKMLTSQQIDESMTHLLAHLSLKIHD